jgi:aminoglycoside phosphotransferase (APT) family kinase protein
MTDKVAVQHDAERTRAGLEGWIGGRGLADAAVALLPGPEATGYSHETIVFELTHDGGSERLVARVEPEERSVFPDPHLEPEYRLLEAISDEPVPLPKLHGFEADASFLGAPFYVMEHLEGLVPPDSPPYSMAGWMHEATPDERTAVWWSGLEAMARAHLVDWKARELQFINAGRTIGLDGELEYWKGYIDFCANPISDVARRAWDWLNATKPTDTDVAMCWGDSRLGNQMFRGGECIALLDWEMACLSDPVQDLAWFIHFDELFSTGLGVPRLEGIPTRAETVGRYEELTGHEVRNLDYFDVFASFRFVLILQRLGTLQIELGQLPADSPFPKDNFAATDLTRLCDEKGVP